MKTKRGIYHRIEDSEYRYELGNFTFVFTSMFYWEKFDREWKEAVQDFNEKANRIYKFKYNIYMDVLAIFRLYQSIEKRGFLVLYGKDELTCLDDLQFVLDLKTEPPSKN